jgi:integration host factor subunit beta
MQPPDAGGEDSLAASQVVGGARAELLVDAVFGCMEQSIRRDEKIEIRGFGSFTVRQYRAYDGRNPRTDAIVPVKPKRLAFFKVGKELAARINQRHGE